MDLFNAYEDIAKERPLTLDEKKECKYYSKLADACTPLAKGLGSEYANQNAYDCIQVHGGSGFMKEYACERLYRDARITSIYEGTTQLQVVAAIRHVTTGTINLLIDSYREQLAAGAELTPELARIKANLETMTEKFQKAVTDVASTKDQPYIDFMARRLVEMAGNVVMSYLLLLDAQRNASFTKSAIVYNNMAQALVNQHCDFIAAFDPAQIACYQA